MDKIKETLEKNEIEETLSMMEKEGDADVTPEEYADSGTPHVEVIAESALEDLGKPSEKKPAKKDGIKRETAAERYKRTIAKSFRGKKRKTVYISEERQDKGMDDFKKTAADLMASYSRNLPIEVKIEGIEPVVMGKDTEMVPVANMNGWKIMIPVREFFPKEELEMETSRIRLFGSPGAVVEVIPFSPGKGADGKKINPFMKMNGQFVAIASRLKAMEIRKRQYWFGINSEKKYVFREGLKVEGRVVFAMRSFIIVDVFGVETKISAEDVSYNRINDCQALFNVGDSVMVRLKSVERNEETGKVTYTATVKDAYKDPRVDAYAKYVRGGVYRGAIAYIGADATKDPHPYCLVRLEGIDVYCPYPDKLGLNVGDVADVAITFKNDDSLRIFGKIRHVDGKNV